ncbi:DUF3422 domain-containing protein [Propionivibrio sp.]|uniref:DUF3422 family protein n=1 Tax=Propionivibrio sp. TaxID=2212460 RepID=UPI00262B4B01|nr:DUF3422 domain-containing protein [Propionivibrio sp.]
MHARFNFTDIEEHPLRAYLNSEFHARAPIPLSSPVLVSHLAFHHEGLKAEDERENVLRLCQTSACRFIENSTTHLMFDAGSFQMRWELHTEYSSYTFFHPLVAGEPLHPDTTALDSVFPDWLSAIPGKLIVATHVELRSTADVSPESVLAGLSPTSGRQMVVSRIANGAAWVFTDFVFDNGFSRFLLLDDTMVGRQPGRAVQRLFEIETYRMMALLGLPVATEVGRWLNGAESRLAELMDLISQANSPEDERTVLADLSKMASEVEYSVARTTFRFGASRAYNSLVLQRIDELREIRVPGYQKLSEFMQRRFLPAMNTCAAMANRQDDLSERVARNSQLLRTRVDIELERQNQELLAQMNNRAKVQLRLQETVEGLSIAAITYYGSQLVQYLTKGAKYLFPVLSPEIATAVSIPLIAVLALFGIKRMRKALAHDAEDSH